MAVQLADNVLNYYALALCILTDHNLESAFYYLTGGQLKLKQTIKIGDLLKLKETMTCKQIGELYGLSKWTVYARIRYYRQKKRLEALRRSREKQQ